MGLAGDVSLRKFYSFYNRRSLKNIKEVVKEVKVLQKPSLQFNNILYKILTGFLPLLSQIN